MDAHSATWLERLLLNIFSYSLVLVPIAVIVLSTKYRLCPSFLQSSALIQLFVNGSYHNAAKQHGPDGEGLIVQEDHDSSAKESMRREHNQDGRPRSRRDDILKFFWCLSGLMVSYLVWGVLQEKIMTTKYKTDHSISTAQFKMLNDESQKITDHVDNSSLVVKEAHITFHDSQFLVFINRIIAFVLAIVALIYDRPKNDSSRFLYLTNGKNQVIHYRNLNNHSSNDNNEPTAAIKPSAPLYQFVFCSLSNILSSWCQYEALKYVNFPTQVLSKTFKIVPVMIMSRILLRKKYKPADYGCALALSLGMFIFLVNQPVNVSHQLQQQHQPHNLSSSYHYQNKNLESPPATKQQDLGGGTMLLSGLLLLSLYLAFDSFTGNWQKSLFTRYQVTNWQMMAAVNLYSILLTLTSLYQLGNLTPALKMVAASRPLLFDCLLMSVMSSIGQFFVYYTINQFGPVIFTVIMTFRQFLAILISCALYGHRLTVGSTMGVLLVFCVIGFQLWHRSSNGKSRHIQASGRTPGDASAPGGVSGFQRFAARGGGGGGNSS